MKSETILLATKVWQNILAEAQATTSAEPVMESYLKSTITNHDNLGSALSFHLSQKLASASFPAAMIRTIMDDTFKDPAIVDQAARDIQATMDRDSACKLYSSPFLYYVHNQTRVFFPLPILFVVLLIYISIYIY